MSQRPILIIGASGKTGRRVNQLLAAQGIPTRPVSRSSDIVFDWEQPKTWSAALDGVDKAYVTFQPDILMDSARAAIAELAELAVKKNVQHIVLLSGRGEPGARRAEIALQESGVAWTIVRASWFCQNFSESFMVDGLIAGELALPAGNVLEPFIDVDDIAEVVAASLIDDRHVNRLYEVTGPRAISFTEAVAEIAKATSRAIRYTQISPQDFTAGLRQAHVPDEIIDILEELFSVVLDGRNERPTDGVMEALGRPARDFSEYARKAAATGIWRA